MRTRSLALLVALATLAAGCGTPGGDSGDNTKKAEESKKNSAKIDVAKAGDVTLTIWDQEVLGGQAAQIKRLNQAFQSTYPNVKIKRVEVPDFCPGTVVDTTGDRDLLCAAFAWADLRGAQPEERIGWAQLYSQLAMGVPTATGGAVTEERLLEEGAKHGLARPSRARA